MFLCRFLNQRYRDIHSPLWSPGYANSPVWTHYTWWSRLHKTRGWTWLWQDITLLWFGNTRPPALYRFEWRISRESDDWASQRAYPRPWFCICFRRMPSDFKIPPPLPLKEWPPTWLSNSEMIEFIWMKENENRERKWKKRIEFLFLEETPINWKLKV